MENVAHFLQTKAISCPDGSRDFDLFGRSAFNRYYYATYLQVRALLGNLDNTWLKAKHKNIPEILTGQVVKKINNNRVRLQKIGDSDAVGICNRAKTSALELANMMKDAYAARVMADYEPDIPIVRDGRDRFRLNMIPVSTAHEWPNRAKEHCGRIRRAWDLTDA